MDGKAVRRNVAGAYVTERERFGAELRELLRSRSLDFVWHGYGGPPWHLHSPGSRRKACSVASETKTHLSKASASFPHMSTASVLQQDLNMESPFNGSTFTPFSICSHSHGHLQRCVPNQIPPIDGSRGSEDPNRNQRVRTFGSRKRPPRTLGEGQWG